MKQVQQEGELESEQSENLSPVKQVDKPSALLKELWAKGLLDAVDYECDNLQLIVNRFIRSGTTRALDVSISQSPLRDNVVEQSSNEEEDEEQSSDEEKDEELWLNFAITNSFLIVLILLQVSFFMNRWYFLLTLKYRN